MLTEMIWGDSFFRHGYAIEGIGCLHGCLSVGNGEQLCCFGELLHQLSKPPQVDLIECRIDFIKYAKGCRFHSADGKQQGDGCEGTLASRKEQQILEFLAREAAPQLQYRL